MQRPGCDPDNMEPADFLCDFCGQCWADGRPMVEGHRGSLICGPCLGVAYVEVVQGGARSAPGGAACTLCLEARDGAMWASGAREAFACLRCVKQSAGVLTKDPESGWRKPGQAAKN